MKPFYILSIVCAGIILLSLFLPYEETYLDWGLGKNPHTYNGGDIKNGWNYLPFTIVPAVIIGLIAGLNAMRENLGTAITGLVVSILNLLYMGFVEFLLSFNFMSYSEIKIGFYIAVLAVLFHLLMMIVHLIRVMRNRKNPKKNAIVANDLLDSEF